MRTSGPKNYLWIQGKGTVAYRDLTKNNICVLNKGSHITRIESFFEIDSTAI